MVLIPAEEKRPGATPYNPLDKKNLATSVADALLASPVQPLPPEQSFDGSGIYAIYYIGPFPQYRKIAERNRDDKFQVPIYIGKAVPKGSRKGKGKIDARTSRSIESASTPRVFAPRGTSGSVLLPLSRHRRFVDSSR